MQFAFPIDFVLYIASPHKDGLDLDSAREDTNSEHVTRRANEVRVLLMFNANDTQPNEGK